LSEFRVALDEEDFAALIRGRELVRRFPIFPTASSPLTGVVRVALSDIGYMTMLGELQRALIEIHALDPMPAPAQDDGEHRVFAALVPDDWTDDQVRRLATTVTQVLKGGEPALRVLEAIDVP
jgi:hypothetical protein